MDGVTVVDHVLLRRLLSILRDKHTPHRVFRETMTDAALILGYESMRALRSANIQVQTPLETTTGTKLADKLRNSVATVSASCFAILRPPQGIPFQKPARA